MNMMTRFIISFMKHNWNVISKRKIKPIGSKVFVENIERRNLKSRKEKSFEMDFDWIGLK